MPSTRAYRTAAVFVAWLILHGLVSSHAQAEEDRIYWADVDGIYWSNLAEGTTQRIITADTRRPGPSAVDAAGGKIYWVDKRGNTIQWSDLDGSNSEPLTGHWGGSGAIDIALDLERGKIYSLGLYDGGDSSGPRSIEPIWTGRISRFWGRLCPPNTWHARSSTKPC